MPIAEPVAEPAPPAAATVVQEKAPSPLNRYDDAFGRYTGDGVRVEIASATSDLLEFDVSALKSSGGRLRAPESGVSVGFTLVRTGCDVAVRVRSRWWIDRVSEGKPSAGELDAATANVLLTPSTDSLYVHFQVPNGWRDYREVGGEVRLPRDMIAVFLDAWNAARAGSER